MPCSYSRFLAGCALAMVVTATAQEPAQKPIGEIFASDASVKGAVQLVGAGMQVMSGSSVAAGAATALLRLTRGGEVRICPRTSLSISSSHMGRDLLLGMSSGAVEAQYGLAASADAILTPDFRILLAGPGQFHIAVGVDARGSTCVRPLADNTASVIVSELMGDGTYQVKPDEQVMFQGGKLASPDHVVGDCGCPAPPPVVRAAASAIPELPNLASLRKSAPPPSLSIPLDAPMPAPETTAAVPPAASHNEVHVEVDAPFVFNASDPELVPLAQIARLRFTARPPLSLLPLPPQPVQRQASSPPSPAPVIAKEARPKRNFLGKIRGFFASIFR